MRTGRRRGFTIWFTGLSGAGKSTVARALERRLRDAGDPVEVLDGDECRTLLSRDLGFSKQDRDHNVCRIGYVARLLSRNGVAVLVAAISPYRAARNAVRDSHDAPFFEVFVDCPLDELERRDVKGLYARARAGEIAQMTGISDPYEAPVSPDIHLRTNCDSINECVDRIISYLMRKLTSTGEGH